MDPDGQARVFFVVGRQGEPGHDDNVNARYVVEHADITGVPDAELTQALRDDLQALVGKRLDSGDADRLQERLERDLPGYEVSRRIQRGSEVGRIRLVYEARKKEPPNWLRFEPLRSNAPLSLRPGVGRVLGPQHRRPERSGSHRSSPSTTRTISSRSTPATACGSRRGSSVPGGLAPASSGPGSTADWREASLSALALNPEIPAAYENRSTITPLLKFAFSPDLSPSPAA